MFLKQCEHSWGFSTGAFGISGDSHKLRAYELGVHFWLAIFQKHFDDFMPILLKRIE